MLERPQIIYILKHEASLLLCVRSHHSGILLLRTLTPAEGSLAIGSESLLPAHISEAALPHGVLDGPVLVELVDQLIGIPLDELVVEFFLVFCVYQGLVLLAFRPLPPWGELLH
jgi:hypothetical protein